MRKGIAFFGDSVFVGIGASKRSLACTKLVQSKMDSYTSVIARTGYTSQDAILRLPEITENSNYTHVVIQFGNNDCRVAESEPKVSLAIFTDNLRNIVRAIRSAGKIPLLCNLQPIDSEKYSKDQPEIRSLITTSGITPQEWQGRYSNQCEQVATEMNVRLIDIRTKFLRMGQEVIAKDGLHPNDLGHQIIAQEISAVLDKTISEPK